jgi:glyceraldehyde-3-phosphate dehydrogenase/erythrose-4-phosphate dehydrogenase
MSQRALRQISRVRVHPLPPSHVYNTTQHHEHIPDVQEASETYLAGILGFETRPLVSVDYVNDSRSSIVDAACTQVGCTAYLNLVAS